MSTAAGEVRNGRESRLGRSGPGTPGLAVGPRVPARSGQVTSPAGRSGRSGRQASRERSPSPLTGGFATAGPDTLPGGVPEAIRTGGASRGILIRTLVNSDPSAT